MLQQSHWSTKHQSAINFALCMQIFTKCTVFKKCPDGSLASGAVVTTTYNCFPFPCSVPSTEALAWRMLTVAARLSSGVEQVTAHDLSAESSPLFSDSRSQRIFNTLIRQQLPQGVSLVTCPRWRSFFFLSSFSHFCALLQRSAGDMFLFVHEYVLTCAEWTVYI